MALLDNMYAPYSHLMQRFSASQTSEPTELTRLDINLGHNNQPSSTDSSPTSNQHSRPPPATYGGVIQTMNLKLENRPPFNIHNHTDNSTTQENNINEDNRKDLKVKKTFIKTKILLYL